VNDTLRRCLDDLESRIDPEDEERLLAEWTAFTEDRFDGDLFSPRRSRRSVPGVEWPAIRVNEALDDFDAMALQQYRTCSKVLETGGGAPLTVRCNYGTSIIPLLFGVRPFVMPEETNTLPTSYPLHDLDAIGRLIDAGVPDIHTGYAAKTFEMGRRFVAIAQEYPNIGRHVTLYHPDAQGPLDICEVVWGSELFVHLLMEPDLVKAMLDLIVDTYIAFMREWERIAPFREGGNAHWAVFHAGNIMLRDDSAMNVSPDLFEEFVRPYDRRLLDEFGGGACHFCGRGDHYIAGMCAMDGLRAINMSQPHLNDMETIFRHTVDKGIKIVGLARRAAEEALAAGRDLRGCVHC
jgi:hypothetical protein